MALHLSSLVCKKKNTEQDKQILSLKTPDGSRPSDSSEMWRLAANRYTDLYVAEV